MPNCTPASEQPSHTADKRGNLLTDLKHGLFSLLVNGSQLEASPIATPDDREYMGKRLLAYLVKKERAFLLSVSLAVCLSVSVSEAVLSTRHQMRLHTFGLPSSYKAPAPSPRGLLQ